MAFPPDAKCKGCNNLRPITRIIVLMPLDEMMKRDQEIQLMALTRPDVLAPFLVKIRESHGSTKTYFRVSVTYACKLCTRDAEKAAAKAPSWCIVEINRGPGPDKVISSG